MSSRPPAPRRRQSAAVYRRRRLVAAGLAVLLLLLLGWGIGALVSRGVAAATGSAEPSESAPPTPVSSPTPASARESGADGANAPVDPASVGECAPADIRLAAATDRNEYTPGQEAVLHLSVTNLSSTPCRLDVGTAQQEFAVKDAEGTQLFSTRVCQVDPVHEERVLEPYLEQTAVYRWDGRAAAAQCGTQGGEIAPGPRLLTVTLGELESRPVSFRMNEGSAAPSASPSSATASPASPGASTPASSSVAAPAGPSGAAPGPTAPGPSSSGTARP